MAYQDNWKNKGNTPNKGGGGGNYDNTPKENPLLKHKDSLLLMSKLEDADDMDNLLEAIKKFAKDFGKDLSSSQLRNVFSKVKTASKPIDIQLLRPKLMYVAARQKPKSEAQRIMEFLETVAADVKTEAQVKDFQTFMESFVAYHKYYYPKDGQ